MFKKLNQIREFLTTGIWNIHHTEVSSKKAFLIKSLRILMISIRSVYEDKIQQRAAALTLYCILSVVPIIALGFAVAKGFGYDQYLKNEISVFFDKKIAESTAVANPNTESVDYYTVYRQIATQLINFADALLARTKGGLVAVIGIVVLFWTIMKVFGNIESAFNDIWLVKKPRTYLRKFTDYFSMMFISPILFITAVVGMVSLQTVQVHSLFSPFLFLIVKFLPIILLISLFTIIFIVMPNIKVTFKAGLVGGIVTGTIVFLTQQVYIYFQIGLSSYNAIYGGFAALPLFIIWLQLTWLIVLFGAKIAFATQNYSLFEFESATALQLSDYSRRILALLISHRIIQTFQKGNKPLTAEELSKILHVPVRTIKDILKDLIKCRIVSEVIGERINDPGYQPAQNVEKFTIKYVMSELDKLGDNNILVKDSELASKLIGLHDDFFKSIEEHPSNIRLKDLNLD